MWHPYAAEGADPDPIVVARAEGAYFWDVDGTRYLDGNASWWTTALGHGPPRLVRTLGEQAARLAHVALAGTTHEPAVRLAAELVAIAPPGLTRAFYTDNGSTAVEVALKMALQMWGQLERPSKRRYVAPTGRSTETRWARRRSRASRSSGGPSRAC